MLSIRNVFLLLLIIVIGLVVSFPARVLVSVLSLDRAGVYLQGVEGRWSAGSSRVLRIRTPDYDVQLDNLHWDIKLLPLLFGSASVQLDAEFSGHVVSAVVSRSWGGVIELLGFNGQTTFDDLRPALKNMQFPVKGNLKITDVSARIENNWLTHVSGQVNISNIVVPTPFLSLSLGDINLHLEDRNTNTGSAVAAVIDEYSGDYGLEGEIELQSDQRYNVELSSEPDESLGSQIQQQMHFIFGAAVNGRFFFEYADSL